MKLLQYTLIVSLSLLSGIANAINPIASWNFDDGKNIDTEAGVTEFSRTTKLNFEGTTSSGKDKIKLEINPKAASNKVFADSIRKKAFRTGTDLKTKHKFSASGKFSKPLSKISGAVAMWICPEDWNGTQRGPFRIFFAANDKNPKTNELLIYKNGSTNQIMFLIGNNNSKQWSYIGRSIWDWKRGDWHFICVSWSKEKIYMYIDGKLNEAKRNALPDADYKLFNIGTRDWKNEGGLTLIDDLMIFDKTLSMSEIDSIYRTTRPLKNDRPSPITYNLGISKPVIDGSISDFEYGAESNGTFNIKTLSLENSCRWAFARDKEKLYFAAETIAPSRKNTAFARDGKLWEDESIELHLEYNGKRWQFIFNSDSAIFDSYMNNPQWNIKNVEQKHVIANKRWSFEGAVNFKDLGINPQENDRIYITLCRGGNDASLIAASPLLRHFLDQANFIKLIFTADAAPLHVKYHELPGESGKLDMLVSCAGNHAGKIKFDGLNTSNRKLAGSTVNFTAKNNVSSALIKTSGMAKEGVIMYEIILNGKSAASAKIPFLSADRIKLSHLRTHIKDQKLETALVINPPISPDIVFEQIIKDKKGNIILQQKNVAGAKNTDVQTLSLFMDIAKLSPGDYDYYFQVIENGKTKSGHHQFFMKPAKVMPWHNFKGGLSDKIPAPWHTPQNSGAIMNCLMQSFDFSSSLFPRNISAGKENIISAPIALRINGRKCVLPGKFEIISRNEQSIKFRTSANYNNIVFSINGILEYDGFCRLALTYAPQKKGQNISLHDLALLIQMSPDQTVVFDDYEPGDNNTDTSVPAVFNKDFFEHPCFWIGNAERGLFIGADNMRGTHVNNSANSLHLQKNTNGTELTLKLVDTKFALKSPRTVEIFLQPTPTKPVPKKFTRPFMYRGGVNSYRITANYSKLFNSYQRRFNDLEGMKRTFNTPPQYYIQGIYNAIYGISPYTPEWPYYIEKWISSPPGPGQYKFDYPFNGEAARNRLTWAFACVNCRDFMNWHLYYINDLVQDKELGIKDMYFDMAYPRACDNQFHNCGWKDDFGRIRKTYPILANREFTKRIVKILKDKNPDAAIMFHPSGEPIAPLYSLIDICVDGERFVSRLAREEAYYDVFNPALMQSTFNGKHNGTVNVYISQLERSASFFNPAKKEYWRRKQKAPEAVRAVRHFLGYCLLHNLHPHAGVCIYNEGEILEKQLYSIGYKDDNFTFIPYWNKNCPVKTNTKNVLVSVYKFPGKTLAVVLNDSKTETLNISLNTSFKFKKIYNLETGKTMEKPVVNIPPKGMNLIVFEEK